MRAQAWSWTHILIGALLVCLVFLPSCKKDPESAPNGNGDPTENGNGNGNGENGNGNGNGETPEPRRLTYPPMTDGAAYSNMLRMLNSLSKMPDWNLAFPENMAKALGSAEENRKDSDWPVFDPDSLEEGTYADYQEFRENAVLGDDEQIVKALVAMVGEYLEQNPVPEGVPIDLGSRTITYTMHFLDDSSERTQDFAEIHLVWRRDGETGQWTVLLKLKPRYGSEVAPDYDYYSISGTPMGDEPSSGQAGRYSVYRTSPRGGAFRDEDEPERFWSLFYNDDSDEVLVYMGGAGEHYRYWYFAPVSGADKGDVFYYAEDSGLPPRAGYANDDGAVLLGHGVISLYDASSRLIQKRMCSGDPVHGVYDDTGVNIYSAGNESAPGYLWAYHRPNESLFYWASGDEQSQPAFDPESWNEFSRFSFQVFWKSDDDWRSGDVMYGIDHLDDQPDEDGGYYYGFVPLHLMPEPVDFLGHECVFATDWPLRHLAPTDPTASIRISPAGFYMLGDTILPVHVETMGMYDEEGVWLPDAIETPLYRSFSLPEFLVLAPDKQDLIDDLWPRFFARTNAPPLTPSGHPHYMFNDREMMPLKTIGLGGYWVLDEEQGEDGEVHVLLIDSFGDVPEYEYRIFVQADSDDATLGYLASGAIAGVFEHVGRTPFEDALGDYGIALRIRALGFWSSDIEAEEESDEIEWISVLERHPEGMPYHMVHSNVFVMNDGEALTVRYRHPDSEEHEYYDFSHSSSDPMLDRLYVEDDGEEPSEDEPPIPPVVWTAMPTEGFFVETSFLPETWQEIHFESLEDGEVAAVRAFRGEYELVPDTGRGAVTINMIYDLDSGEWVSPEIEQEETNEETENGTEPGGEEPEGEGPEGEDGTPGRFELLVAADTYLNGVTAWEFSFVRTMDTMTVIIEEPGPERTYEYRVQDSGLRMSGCFINACATVESSNCDAAEGGVFPGGGLDYPEEERNPGSVIAACTQNCRNHFMCQQGERLAHYIDCENMDRVCSADWSPIDVASCEKVRTHPDIQAELDLCREQCQREHEVEFRDPQEMIEVIEGCVERYGHIIQG